VRIREIVIDSAKPAELARFWARVLGGYALRPYDAAELARLAALDLTPETDPIVMVDGPGPTLCFQHTREPKAGRNRLHLDLAGAVRPAEIARLIELGATVRDHHDRYSVMLDPEGNEFCVVDADP
jgi:Glyoxalase-like domain